jgi:hypothetical protein
LEGDLFVGEGVPLFIVVVLPVVVGEVLRVDGESENLVALGLVGGLDEFGGLALLAVPGELEVVIVFLLDVEVEGGVAQVLLAAEALEPRQVLVEFGLRSPPLDLDVLLLVRLASLH